MTRLCAKKTAFVPNVAKTEAGYFLGVDPVRIAKLNDVAALTVIIAQAMASGNPQVPTPNRIAFSKPVILKPAGAKNWNAFVEKGDCFTIFQSMEGLEIAETGRNKDGQWVDCPSLIQNLPAGSSESDIAKSLIEGAARRSDLA